MTTAPPQRSRAATLALTALLGATAFAGYQAWDNGRQLRAQAERLTASETQLREVLGEVTRMRLEQRAEDLPQAVHGPFRLQQLRDFEWLAHLSRKRRSWYPQDPAIAARSAWRTGNTVSALWRDPVGTGREKSLRTERNSEESPARLPEPDSADASRRAAGRRSKKIFFREKSNYRRDRPRPTSARARRPTHVKHTLTRVTSQVETKRCLKVGSRGLTARLFPALIFPRSS